MSQESSFPSVGGNVQKSPSSKAAALLTRGAFSQYVSTAKGRERRWRLFSTFPERNFLVLPEAVHLTFVDGHHNVGW